MEASKFVMYFIGIVISWTVLYYVIKSAVKNGVIEALSKKQIAPNTQEYKPEKKANLQQIELQKKYDNGEISFEVYHSEWNRLS